MSISRSRQSLFYPAELASFRPLFTSYNHPSHNTCSNSTILSRPSIPHNSHASLLNTPKYLKFISLDWLFKMGTVWAVAKHEAKLCWGFMHRDVSMGMLPVPAFATASLLYRHATALEMLTTIPSKSHSHTTTPAGLYSNDNVYELTIICQNLSYWASSFSTPSSLETRSLESMRIA